MKLTVLALLLAAIVITVGTLVAFRGPKVNPPPHITIDRTAARIERGQYLFTLMDCGGCHSERDFSKYLAPELPGRRGVGVILPPELGLPGKIVTSNITPDRTTGIGEWTDGEIVRAIREGISRNGRALFPMMPYQSYRNLSDEDVFSLVAYLRSLPAVRNSLPKTQINFPVSFLIQSAPQPVEKVPCVDAADQLAYGKYLVTIVGCADCHTQKDKGAPVEGMEFAGGFAFRLPGNLSVSSANITPHPETGIGSWSEDRFVSKFAGFRSLKPESLPPAVQGNFTMMPWWNLRQTDDKDLRAIYAYLRTLKPVANKVDPHAPAPQI